jgi:lipopolysaccharide transport system ATP-binding protein
VLRIDEEIWVSIEYDVLRDIERGYAALWIKHIDGTEVLSSGALPFVTSTPDEYCGKPMPKGSYRAVCTVPADFLNAGIYTFSAILGVGSYPGQILVRDVVQCEVIDTSAMRKEYQGGWLGVVRPKFSWKTRRTG